MRTCLIVFAVYCEVTSFIFNYNTMEINDHCVLLTIKTCFDQKNFNKENKKESSRVEVVSFKKKVVEVVKWAVRVIWTSTKYPMGSFFLHLFWNVKLHSFWNLKLHSVLGARSNVRGAGSNFLSHAKHQALIPKTSRPIGHKLWNEDYCKNIRSYVFNFGMQKISEYWNLEQVCICWHPSLHRLISERLNPTQMMVFTW